MDNSLAKQDPDERKLFRSSQKELLHTTAPADAFVLGPLLVGVWLVVGELMKIPIFKMIVENDRSLAAKLISLILPLLAGGIAGLGLALLFHAIYHRRFSELMPGHWRLIMGLISSVAGVVASLWLDQPGFTVGMASFSMVTIVEQLVIGFLMMLFYGLVAYWTKEAKTWRIVACFMLVGIASMTLQVPVALRAAETGVTPMRLLSMFLSGIRFFALFGAFLVLLVGLTLDRKMQTPRDVYHWIGVVYIFALPAVYILSEAFLFETR